MAVVEDELLGSERTHAMAQQNERHVGVLSLRETTHPVHVLYQQLDAARPEIPEVHAGWRGAAVPAMVIAVDRQALGHQRLDRFRVSPDVLAHPVRNLDDPTRGRGADPPRTGHAQAIGTSEPELRRAR